MNVSVVINAASGSCNETDEGELVRIITDTGNTTVSTWCGSGDGLTEALAAIRKTKPELLVVLGGDGTIRTAIEE